MISVEDLAFDVAHVRHPYSEFVSDCLSCTRSRQLLEEWTDYCTEAW
jgi:hypothetical protein